MSIRTQIQYVTGINEEFLQEGIRFFKNSKRIEKLIQKFQNAMTFAKDTQIKQDVTNYIRELQRAKLDFEGVEQKFAMGDKEEAKEEYRQLRIKFASIIADINKESIKKFMIIGGIVAFAFATFAAVVPSHVPVVAPSLHSGGMISKDALTASEKAIQIEIKANNVMLQNIRDKAKAFGLFEKNQKLIERLAQEQIKIQVKLEK